MLETDWNGKVNEGCVFAYNADKIQDNSPGSIPSNFSVTNIEGNSVLCDIIVEDLAQQAWKDCDLIS